MIPTDDNRDGIALTGATDTIPKSMLDDAPSIEKLRKRLDEAREDPQGGREKAEKRRDYFDGPKQLSSEIRTILRTRAQPPIYTNRVRPAVNGILGVLEQGRRDPKGMPRNPQDEASADVCTKTLRFINDQSKFNDTQIDVAENFFIEGTGAVIIELVDEKIVPTQIRWEEFYYDPYSRRADFKDARYMGVAKWMDAAQLRERYDVRLETIGDPLAANGTASGDSWQDRPESIGWVDRRRKRVMLVEEYAIEAGKWMRCVYIATGVLEYGPSPYVNERGTAINPIEAISCYVDRDNLRYSPVEDMIPIQDEVNAGRSRALHLMNSRQVQNVDPSAPLVDDATVRMEAAKADGVIPQGWQVVSTAETTQANIIRMQEAKSEIERMGPTPAVLGRQEGGNQSGRARLVSQQAGLTELARPLGRLHGWVLRVYEQMWFRAKQYWTTPMWIRVTDELKAAEFLQINEPVMGMIPQPTQDPLTGQMVVQMVPGQTDTKNRLASLDMDIILDQDDDTANLQQEVWAEIMELLRIGMSPFSPEFEIAIEMSPLSDKGRILERLKAKREEMQQAQAQQMQAEQEAKQKAEAIGEATAVADIENTKADTAVKTATALEKMADRHAKELDQEREASGEKQDREDEVAERDSAPSGD